MIVSGAGNNGHRLGRNGLLLSLLLLRTKMRPRRRGADPSLHGSATLRRDNRRKQGGGGDGQRNGITTKVENNN